MEGCENTRERVAAVVTVKATSTEVAKMMRQQEEYKLHNFELQF